MRLLAIDTSAEACSVGVAVDDRPPVLRSLDVARAHAERLMPMVAEAMAEAGLAFAALDRIAVTVGPGSFTGVRIGVAAGRGLALATGAATVGIGTMTVHAADAAVIASLSPVVVAIAAGRGELYVQRFLPGGMEASPPQLGPAEMWAPLVDERTVLCGSGADALNTAAGRRCLVVHRRTSPAVGTLVRLARAATPQAEPLRPLYLRPPDAKPQAHAQVARR